jgi:hypothetical protein
MTSSLALLALGITLTAVAAPNGEAIFKGHCTPCHGNDGKGRATVGTPDFTTAKIQDSLTDEEIVNTIANVRKGTIHHAGMEGGVVTTGNCRRCFLCTLSGPGRWPRQGSGTSSNPGRRNAGVQSSPVY